MDKVLCVIEESFLSKEKDEDELWLDLDENLSKYYWVREQKVIPLYNHPHSDKENGQEEIHYHVDGRYIKDYPKDFRISLPLKSNQRLEYRYLHKKRDNEIFRTNVNLISKSKLKYKCIHKGKCPHRGFDLSNIQPDENGIITCPLHSLKFNTKDNNKIINFNQ